MIWEEVSAIIRNENLKKYNLNEDRPDGEHELIIKQREGKWIIYFTDERASLWGIERMYDNESDALDEFIYLLRLANKQD